MIVAWLSMYLCLRNRLKILYFKKDSSNRRFAFQFLAWASLFPALLISQSLLTTSTSRLIQISDIYDINETPKARYYNIEKFKVADHFGGSHYSVETSGRYNEHLNIRLYFVFPITSTIDGRLEEKPKYWYGIEYYKQINNRLEQQQKEGIFDRFYSDSVKKVENFDFYDLVMLERLPTSSDKDMFLEAVSARIKTTPESSTIILRPTQESYKDLNGDKLEWIFYSFGIGVFAFLFFLLLPGYDQKEHERQLKGVKSKSEDHSEFLSLLIPQRDHFAAPILINLNIAIFIIGVIAGIHFLHPSALDLLAWGGNRRLETTSGEWWRLFTSMFLHGGVMHLLLNCYGLILASIFIEPVIGKWRFFVIYILSGLSGSLSSIWWYENTVSVGASGAIFGLYGAILGLLLTNAFPREGKSGIFSMIGIYVGINLLWGLSGGVDNAAHIGGLISGVIFGISIYMLTKDRGKFEF